MVYHVKLYHVMVYNMIVNHVMLHHHVVCHVMVHHLVYDVAVCHVMLHHHVVCHVMLYHVTVYHVKVYHVIYHATPYPVTKFYEIVCSVHFSFPSRFRRCWWYLYNDRRWPTLMVVMWRVWQCLYRLSSMSKLIWQVASSNTGNKHKNVQFPEESKHPLFC